MNFEEEFRAYTIVELLRIIQNPQARKPIEIYMAKKTLDARDVSEEELLQAKAELENEGKSQEPETPKEEVGGNGSKWSSFLNLIHRSETRVEEMITTIYLLLFLVVSVILIEFAQNLYPNLTDGNILVEVVLIVGCLWRLGILFLVAFLFFKKKKLGWILLLLYASYHFYSSFFDVFNDPAQLLLYILNIVTLLLYGGIMLIVCKKAVREVYGIDNTVLTIFLVFIALAFISRAMYLII
jgi:hypothetical protein